MGEEGGHRRPPPIGDRVNHAFKSKANWEVSRLYYICSFHHELSSAMYIWIFMTCFIIMRKIQRQKCFGKLVTGLVKKTEFRMPSIYSKYNLGKPSGKNKKIWTLSKSLMNTPPHPHPNPRVVRKGKVLTLRMGSDPPSPLPTKVWSFRHKKFEHKK